MTNDDLFTTKEAARYLKISPSKLAHDRMKKGEIPYMRIGVRIIRYSKTDLDEYLKEMRNH